MTTLEFYCWVMVGPCACFGTLLAPRFMQIAKAALSLVFLLFLISCVTVPKNPVLPQIHEIKSMTELESWLVPDTLVLFDLDNTVFESTSILGHSSWYYDQLKKHPDQADKVLQRSWKGVLSGDVKPVEEVTVHLIRKLQSEGVRVMGFTARDLILLDATLRQLKSIDVDFTKTSLAPDSKFVHGGVLFAEKNFPKGLALKSFLNRVSFKPKRVVLVDDMRHNLESVCGETGAIGLYYPIVDNKRDIKWEADSDIQWLMEESASNEIKNARPGNGI